MQLGRVERALEHLSQISEAIAAEAALVKLSPASFQARVIALAAELATRRVPFDCVVEGGSVGEDVLAAWDEVVSQVLPVVSEGWALSLRVSDGRVELTCRADRPDALHELAANLEHLRGVIVLRSEGLVRLSIGRGEGDVRR